MKNKIPMLTLDELEKIRPGDVITYEDRWLHVTFSNTEKVIEVARRCGFDKDGHLVEGYDDYVITDSKTEVSYKEIIKIEKEKLENEKINKKTNKAML